MPEYTVRPIQWKTVWVKYLLGAIALFLSGLALFYSFKAAERYRRVSADPLKIPVRITHIEHDTDSDGDDYYDAMVTYEVNGVTYKNKYDRTYKKGALDHMVGQTVQIVVDPSSPGTEIEDIQEEAEIIMYFACFGLMCAMLILNRRDRRSYVDTYGWNRESVQKDLYFCVLNQNYWPAALVPGMTYVISVILYPRVYMFTQDGSAFLVVVGVFAAVVGVIILVKYLKALSMVRNQQFCLRRETCVDKRIVPDSDGPDSHYIVYSDGVKRWEKLVPHKLYLSIRTGDTVESAYLEGAKKPLLNYSRENGMF